VAKRAEDEAVEGEVALEALDLTVLASQGADEPRHGKGGGTCRPLAGRHAP